MAKRKLPQWLLPLVYMLAFVLVWSSFQHFSNTVQPKQVPYSDFLSEVRSGHGSEGAIDEEVFVAKLKTDAAKKEPAAQISTERIPGMDETSLLGDLEAQHVTFSGHVTKASWWALVLPWVVPILFFV